MNKITLAICNYNKEKYLEETLTSIVNQTFQEFDLLITDDCSSDNSVRIINNFFKIHERRHKVVTFDINKGIAAARRYVVKNTNTKYILFVDGDDCPYPTLVEKMFLKIESDRDLMAVGCYHHYINSNSKKIGGGLFLGSKTKEEFYIKAKNKKLVFMQPTAIINREDLLNVNEKNITGFTDARHNSIRFQDLVEDLDLWTRMSDRYIENKAIIVIPEVLNRYRKTDQSISANSFGMVLRMRHIKSNLLLRRAGKKEKAYEDFYRDLTQKELKLLKLNAEAADCLRNGVYFLKKGKIYNGIKSLIKSIWAEPGYLWQKIKSNSGLLK